ncbi:MAG: 6-carboxytetrahydropterin synthase [Candidatus Caenarcaniphilales bacterium]|nr:6-carboxytetrahydropterin synthase [Candidatus Caenarcaniphilales bacterium]
MVKLIQIELEKERFKFSAGHFTVFSAADRERLHGHNFRVKVHLTLSVIDNGMSADYKILKDKVQSLCDELDEYFLIPLKSPYLRVESIAESGKIEVTHAEDRMIFYAKDLKLLPLENITIEELAFYFTERFCEDRSLSKECGIMMVSFGVSSGDGQFAFYSRSDF